MFVWIREILRINVNPDSKEEKMIRAIKKQKLNVIIKLLKYDINVDYVDAIGNNCFNVGGTARKGHLEIVNILLVNNANINYSDDESSGYTALCQPLQIIIFQ